MIKAYTYYDRVEIEKHIKDKYGIEYNLVDWASDSSYFGNETLHWCNPEEEIDNLKEFPEGYENAQEGIEFFTALSHEIEEDEFKLYIWW